MTGRYVELLPLPPSSEPGEVVLGCHDLSIHEPGGRVLLDRVDLAVRSGEIVGIAGVAGNGQSELAEALAGLRAVTSGTIVIAGRDVTGDDVAARRGAGLTIDPRRPPRRRYRRRGQRHRQLGLRVSPGSSNHRARNSEAEANGQLGTGINLAIRCEDSRTEHLGRQSVGGIFRRSSPLASSHTRARCSSQSNQLAASTSVRSSSFTSSWLPFVIAGGGILLISAELSEVISLSQRILVMFEGRIIAELDAATATEEELGLLMAGGDVETTRGCA